MNRTQRCDTCSLPLPLTDSFFDRKSDSATGFRNTCKSCRKSGTLIAANGTKRIDDFTEAADNSLLDRAAVLLTLGPGSSIPHTAEVYEAAMKVFGGPSGYAAQLMSTYLAASPGSGVRKAILTLIQRMGKDTVDSGKATIRLDMLTDEELEAEAMSRLVNIVKQNPALVKQMLEEHGGAG